MSEFEEYIKAKYPNRSLKILFQKFKDINGTLFYGVKEVEDQAKVWNHQQAIINDLKAQLNNMEACYIEKKKQVEAVSHMLEGDLKYVEQDRRGNFDFLQMAMIRCLGDAIKALRGAND